MARDSCLTSLESAVEASVEDERLVEELLPFPLLDLPPPVVAETPAADTLVPPLFEPPPAGGALAPPLLEPPPPATAEPPVG